MSTDIVLGDSIHIVGYQWNPDQARLDEEIVLTLAWEPTVQESPPADSHTTPWTLFAHLIGFDGQVFAQADVLAQNRPEGITLTQLRLTPRPGAAPGDYALAIGAYLTADGTPLQGVTGEPRTTLGNINLDAMPYPPYTQQKTARIAVSGRPLLKLVGYDWDHTIPGRTRIYRHWETETGFQTEVIDTSSDPLLLPDWFGPWGQLRQNTQLPVRPKQHYVPLGDGIIWLGPDALSSTELAPDDSLTIAAQFGSTRPVMRDRVVSIRLVGYEADGSLWAWWDLHDSIPALGAIPTLKWVRGSIVRDPHPLTVDSSATPGQQVGGILLLYDAFTNRPVSILDEVIVTNYVGIPLGNAEVKK